MADNLTAPEDLVPGELVAFYKTQDGTVLAVNVITKPDEGQTEVEALREVGWKVGDAFAVHVGDDPVAKVL